MKARELACVLAMTSLATSPAHASWPKDAPINLQVAPTSSHQVLPAAVSDGAGGVIVAWMDGRNGDDDIYAQRISADGELPWGPSGVAVCNAAGSQIFPSITSDGAGGAVVAWQDYRAGDFEIFAQRISSSGARLWDPAQGVALTNLAGTQGNVQLVADGAGGAIAVWIDYRGGVAHLYARRVNGSGVPQWAANGVAIQDVGATSSFSIAGDGSGGMVAAWIDDRNGQNDCFAQRLTGGGSEAWASDGLTLGGHGLGETDPKVLASTNGTTYVTWISPKDGPLRPYLQRILANGAFVFGDGVALTTHDGGALRPSIVGDGVGGAVVAWTTLSGFNIHAQRVGSNTVFHYVPSGAPVGVAASSDYSTVVSSDGSAVIAAWAQSGDVHAQRIEGNGFPDWSYNARAISTGSGTASAPQACTDGRGGAIVAWSEARDGDPPQIYAQRIDRFGFLGSPEPRIASVRDVRGDQGGRVKVSWEASDRDVLHDPVVAEYRVWRSVPPLAAAQALADGALRLRPEQALDRRIFDGDRRLIDVTVENGVTVYWEYLGDQPAAAFEGYSYVAPTSTDSTGTGNPLTWFRVHAVGDSAVWSSAADSGYSVDDLAPAAPTGFTGTFGGSNQLTWNANTEPDLSGYRLYRDTDPSFTPGPGNLVSALAGTNYLDPAGQPYVYKLSAIDVHGNESAFAVASPPIVGAIDPAPLTLRLGAPIPNPTSGPSTIEFQLPLPERVSVSIMSVAGRKMRTVFEGPRGAGSQRIAWDGRDDVGQLLPNGIYVVVLQVRGRTLTERLLVLR